MARFGWIGPSSTGLACFVVRTDTKGLAAVDFDLAREGRELVAELRELANQIAAASAVAQLNARATEQAPQE